MKQREPKTRHDLTTDQLLVRGSTHCTMNPQALRGNVILLWTIDWKSGEPNDDENDEDCGELHMTSDWTWNDTHCTNRRRCICELVWV